MLASARVMRQEEFRALPGEEITDKKQGFSVVGCVGALAAFSNVPWRAEKSKLKDCGGGLKPGLQRALGNVYM